MFYIQDDWFLVAFIYDPRSNGKQNYLVSGFREMDFDTKSAKDPNYLLRNGINVLEIQNEEMINALVNAGLTTTCPIRIKNDLTLEPLFGKDVVLEEKPIKFLPTTAEVISENGEFDSPYAMCPSCGHPITVEVRCKINQTTLDKINSGKEVIINTGSASFQCNHCGRGNSGKIYKNIRVHKTTDSYLNFSKNEL